MQVQSRGPRGPDREQLAQVLASAGRVLDAAALMAVADGRFVLSLTLVVSREAIEVAQSHLDHH